METCEGILNTLLGDVLNSLETALHPGETLVCSYSKHLSELFEQTLNDAEVFILGNKDKLLVELENYNHIYREVTKKLPKNACPTAEAVNEAILEEKEKYITEILEEYFKKWILEGEGDNAVTVPYFMKPILVSKLEKKYIDEDSMLNDESLSVKDRETIKNYYTYKKEKNKISEGIKKIIDKGNATDELSEEIRNLMSQDSNKSFDYQFYNYKISDGKSFPEMFKYVYKKLYDENIKGSDIIKLMEDNQIGADCSDFVSRALATIFEKLRYPFEKQLNSIQLSDHRNDKLCTAMKQYPIPSANKRTMKNKDNTISIGVKCANIRPGDILLNETHIIIISGVERDQDDKIISFTTMESGSDYIDQDNINSVPKRNKSKKKPGVIKRIFNDVTGLSAESNIFNGPKSGYVVYRSPGLIDFYGIKSDIMN